MLKAHRQHAVKQYVHGCWRCQGVARARELQHMLWEDVVSSHTDDQSGSSSCCVSWRTYGRRRAAGVSSALPRGRAPATPAPPWAQACCCPSGRGACGLPRRWSSSSRRLALRRRSPCLRPGSYGYSGGAPWPVGGLMCTRRWAPWS